MARGLQKLESQCVCACPASPLSLPPLALLHRFLVLVGALAHPLAAQNRQKNAAKANAGGKSNLKTRAAAFKVRLPFSLSTSSSPPLLCRCRPPRQPCVASFAPCSPLLLLIQISCPACKLPLSDYTNFKAHFESKHPKLPLPTEESLAPK